MATATLVPLSEYLSTTYRPDCEYLDGVILERNLGERDHSNLQMLIAGYFFLRRKEWGVSVFPEHRVQVSAKRFRVPDITVMLEPVIDEQIITHPPFLCIEILSKDDTMTQMQERIGDYLRFGVPNVWVIDPRTRRCFTYAGKIMQEISEGFLPTSRPEICVPLSELFD